MVELSPELRKQIEQGIAILKRGGLVAYPTDTVYGLGASAASREAVERVFQAKSRPRDMALPLLVASVAQIEELAGSISPIARCLIDAFLPGVLTLVLRASEAIPGYLKTAEGTVALRIPGHPIPIALIDGSGAPIVGTSANLSGQPSPLTAEEVRSQLGDSVDLVIDGGRCPGRESTIVDVTGESPAVLREGAISRQTIERICTKTPSGRGR
ncbi:MAG: threonylcarbamoyl-AMP synthase [Chloroflexi bacterium RBG_16_57_8]|nr:MAG: threonylcarbamoyl-AMP synthase [Chloroflexi bacterium RBG_16_57_8]